MILFVILCVCGVTAVFIDLYTDKNKNAAFKDWDGKYDTDFFWDSVDEQAKEVLGCLTSVQ